MDKMILAGYGIDYDSGVKNCMGNQGFYYRILSLFLGDACFSKAKAALSDGNQKELFNLIHELKGISGNAALTELYMATVPLAELLRPGNAEAEEIKRMFSVVEEAYTRACEGTRILLAERNPE